MARPRELVSSDRIAEWSEDPAITEKGKTSEGTSKAATVGSWTGPHRFEFWLRVSHATLLVNTMLRPAGSLQARLKMTEDGTLVGTQSSLAGEIELLAELGFPPLRHPMSLEHHSQELPCQRRPTFRIVLVRLEPQEVPWVAKLLAGRAYRAEIERERARERAKLHSFGWRVEMFRGSSGGGMHSS